MSEKEIPVENKMQDTKTADRRLCRSLDAISIRNAKILCFVLIVCFSVYHGVRKWHNGLDSCSNLFTDGRYENMYDWQPTGCMKHHYNRRDIKYCLEKRKFLGLKSDIALLGSSRMQPLKLAMSNVMPNTVNEAAQHFGLALKFFEISESSNAAFLNKLSEVMMSPPALLIIQAQISNDQILNENIITKDIQSFRTLLEQASKAVISLTQKGTQIVWLLHHFQEDLAKNVKPSGLTREHGYNEALREALGSSSVHLWESNVKIEEYNFLGSENISPMVQTETLLNYLCNDYVATKDASCCKTPEPVTISQAIFFGAMALSIVWFLVMSFHRWIKQPKQQLTVDAENQQENKTQIEKQNQWYQLSKSLFSLSIILIYFFLCDRANFYMKENKHYSHLVFFVPFLVILLLGFIYTKQSRFTSVLHRDQTDEWKGWMQLMILLYHVTGASQVIPIYMFIRLLVTSYLFLTGYGHFCFFWSKGDPSIVRFFQVMFRMNFLTLVLCLTMNRPYQFYYFVPLVSFWYLVVYLILVIPPHVTAASTKANRKYYVYMLLKFAVALGIISLLYIYEDGFEHLFTFSPWKLLFTSTDGSLHEWRFRWELDRYSVLIGMSFAFLYLLSQRFSVIDDSKKDDLFNLPVSLLVSLVSIGAVGGFMAFVFSCSSKPECNHINSYIGYFPIISFIFLRNVWGRWRCRFSHFFAWFGGISLELFIGQYHIWLASDTYGVLVLIPGIPILNFVFITFIFVCVAHEIHMVTGVIAPLAVPKDLKLLARNIAVFCVLLLPIGFLRSYP